MKAAVLLLLWADSWSNFEKWVFGLLLVLLLSLWAVSAKLGALLKVIAAISGQIEKLDSGRDLSRQIADGLELHEKDLSRSDLPTAADLYPDGKPPKRD